MWLPNKNFNFAMKKIFKPILLSNFTPWGWAISSKNGCNPKISEKTNFKFLTQFPTFFKNI